MVMIAHTGTGKRGFRDAMAGVPGFPGAAPDSGPVACATGMPVADPASDGLELDFDWLEERLHRLGFHMVLCVRSPATFEHARVERLRVSGKPSQYDDLQVFVDEQERMHELIRRTRLPLLELDVSDGDIGKATDTIADWMEDTGGLWATGEGFAS